MAQMESLDTYTFDLRRGLRDAARVGLGQLAEMIGEIGYGWLDGHMEGILERTSRGPITELMKTPSRTQTVKKTRAITTAMKDRGDKLQTINLHLGSPLSKRAPLSPLQPRSVNAGSVLSPSPMKSNAPIKALSPKPGTPSKKSDKTAKAKKAKIGTNDENASTSQSTLFSPRGGNVAQPMVILSPSPKKASKTQTNKAGSQTLSGPSKGKSLKYDAMDLDGVAASSQHASSSSLQQRQATQADTTMDDGSMEEGNTTIKAPVPGNKTAVASVTFASEQKQTKTFGIETDRAQSSTVAFATGPASTAAAKNGPMRQVRSSWLTKALGTGSVPITDHSDNMRKSFAAPPRQEPIDFSNLRKSLAPAGTLVSASDAIAPVSSSKAGSKRPSDGADEEHQRPEKFQRAEVQPIRLSHDPKSSQSGFTSTNSQTPAPAPVSQPSSVTQETQASSVSTVQTLEQTRADRHRSDIHKVTRALDELRERAAAKEAHKQKAALNASSGPRSTLSTGERNNTTTPGAAPTGGFLKGLGNLGMGLGRSLGLAGTARSAEEEALRLQAELEEDRRAEDEARKELDRLMEELKGDTVEPTEQKADAVEKTDKMEVDPVEDKRDDRASTAEIQDEDMIAVELDEPVAPVERKEHRPTQPIQLFQRTSVPRLPTPSPPTQSAKSQAKSQIQLAEHTPVKSAKDVDVFNSTTPAMSPPRRIFNMPSIAVQAGAPVVAPVAAPLPFIQPEPKKQAAVPGQTHAGRMSVDSDQDDDELDEDDVELPELPEPVESEEDDADEEEEGDDENAKEMPAKKMFKSETGTKKPQTMSAASSSGSLASLAQSTASLSQSGMFGHASTIAGKTLGFKPAPGHVKSLQLAAAAAKKEQAATDKKTAIREQLEQRRAEATKKKQEEERAKVEEDKKVRAAELEEKKRVRMELERKRKERDEKVALANREKAIKEEAEKAALKAKTDEEARKRKLAQAALLKKSAGVVAATASTTFSAGPIRGKDPLRTIKPVYPLPSTAPVAGGLKHGPTAFRTAESSTTSTITLVQPKTGLGPPSRPSSQLPLQRQSYQPQPFLTTKTAAPAAAVLQQSRVQLQSQLDEKALETQSEDIVLPDIASEYSDSDDSDRSPDFKRPQWAESPELRHALQAQSSRNPDELFGPIKPLNMEELFKTRTNKFRARTSSANWNGGDRLTKAEEVEYAKRMGFKPILPSSLGGGSGL